MTRPPSVEIGVAGDDAPPADLVLDGLGDGDVDHGDDSCGDVTS